MASGSSIALRTKERPFQRKRFFTVCIGMVLAPRVASPSSASCTTPRICPQSTPSWLQNWPSSDIITDCTSTGAILSNSTHCRS
ncbi:hypothetical protein D3C72_1977260 [compost metagenome]